jgi:hypothetical protein
VRVFSFHSLSLLATSGAAEITPMAIPGINAIKRNVDFNELEERSTVIRENTACML